MIDDFEFDAKFFEDVYFVTTIKDIEITDGIDYNISVDVFHGTGKKIFPLTADQIDAIGFFFSAGDDKIKSVIREKIKEFKEDAEINLYEMSRDI